MKSVKEKLKSSKLIVSMLMVQVFATGMQLLSRIILVNGTFIFALTAYRHIVAALFVAPFALYFERGREKKFTFKVWFWIFVNALAGMTMALGLFYYGLRDTSATYSINFLNLVPICTFAISIICRMEKVRVKTWGGKAKCVGAILCVGGALVTSLYKGHEFFIGNHNHGHHDSHPSPFLIHKTNMLRGTIFLLLSCFSYTAWFIAQIHWNLQLVTILYSGALATAATFSLLSWAISIKGPTYPPMFNPLALIFVAISEALLLGEPLKAGTLLGMVMIISGLYSFLWGKKKEPKSLAQSNVVAAEVSTNMVAEPAGPQATAVVVPSASSPNNSVVLEVETTCNK
ncbi:hypothetical protein PIB30_055289 [Stylosanthes scabra]|uniref:WAT1-related protein n=1 Tax=Stylosanthes scabra TaxID=79078 RepID=A0ABU6WHA9_9FABA|nr:hypothetical protein [Stylosanthes scabra]